MTLTSKILALAAALALSACATTGDLPPIRYLEAAQRGETPPRVSEEQFRETAYRWTDAVTDAAACRLPIGDVASAAFSANAELSAMREHVAGDTGPVMAEVTTDLLMAAVSSRPRPPRSRCASLSRWLPQVRARREEVGSWSVLERLLTGR